MQRRGSPTRPSRVVDWGVQIASKAAGRDAALERTEPRFEDTVLFSRPVTVKAVKVMMRGSRPWGCFVLSNAMAL